MSYSWRLLATGALFTIFGVGGLFLGALAFPTIALLSRDRDTRTRRARACISRSFRLFLWLVRSLGVCRFDIDPLARRTLAQGGGVIAANHPTLIDVVVLLALIEQGNCVVKRELWRNLVLAHVVRAAAYIPNDNWEQLAPACEQVLERGEALIVFPEATRSVPGEPLRLRRGAAALALQGRVPVKLVHLTCVPPMLFKGAPWYRIPRQQPCFAMRLGDTLDPRDYWREGEGLSVAARRLTQAIQFRLSELPSDERVGTRA